MRALVALCAFVVALACPACGRGPPADAKAAAPVAPVSTRMLGPWAPSCDACAKGAECEHEADASSPGWRTSHRGHEHSFDVDVHGEDGVAQAAGDLLIFLDAKGEPYARVEGPRYVGTRKVEIGDSIVAYRRGHDVAAIDIERADGARVEFRKAPGIYRVTADPPLAAARFRFTVTVGWGEGAGSLLLDRCDVSGEEASAGIPVPDGALTSVAPKSDIERFWWPTRLHATPGGADKVTVEPLRDVPLDVGQTHAAFVKQASATNGAFPATSPPRGWGPQKMDGLTAFAFRSAPRIARAKDGLILCGVPAYPFHLFAQVSEGLGAYAFIAPDAARCSMTFSALDPVATPVPLIAGEIPPTGTMLAPGRLDLGTLSSLSHRELYRRSVTQDVEASAPWPGLRLPPVEVLTAWHGTSGIAYLERGQDGRWTGAWEDGRVLVAAPRGRILTGELAVDAVLPGTGSIRISGGRALATYAVEGREEFLVPGLPKGLYSVVAATRDPTAPAGKAGKIRSVVRITAEEPEARLIVGAR